MTVANSTTTTKERPVIFGAESVRAILDGTKTQTRRVVKNAPKGDFWRAGRVHWGTVAFEAQLTPPSLVERVCPYGKVGERLWVREAWRHGAILSWKYSAETPVRTIPMEPPIVYAADYGIGEGPWSSPLFLKRANARLILEIEDVRVERLQDISDEDCLAEGIDYWYVGDDQRRLRRSRFARHWDDLNAKRGYSWETNPWVWVVEFRRATDGEGASS